MTESYTVECRVRHMLEDEGQLNRGRVTFGQRQRGSPDSLHGMCM